MMDVFSKLKRPQKILQKFLLVVCAIIHAACMSSPTPQVFLEGVYVTVDPNANQDTPVAMDVIVVYEEALVQSLFKLSAAQYFSQKFQIIRDNPGQMDIFSYEVVPGQNVDPRSITLSRPIPFGGVVFANYLTPGDHRIRIGKEIAAKITLGPKDFFLTPLQEFDD